MLPDILAPSFHGICAMYTEFQICETLVPKHRCFRVQVYDDGKFVEVFHEHVPAYRISAESTLEALRSLALKYSPVSASTVLHTFLNKRGKEPAAASTFSVNTEYPEAGVLRRYCSTGQVNAWTDEVLVASKFRSAGKG